MAELGYYEPLPGIYGTENPATGPSIEARAALQEASAQLATTFPGQPGYIPPTYAGASAGPCYTEIGAGNPPIIGWTVQNSNGLSPFRAYAPSGHTPDWTDDGNPIGSGMYDMNPVMTAFPPNPLNVGPIGDTIFGGLDGEPTNPNAPNTDVSGGNGDLEY